MTEQASGWLKPVHVSELDPGHKPLPYLSIYENYLETLRNKSFTLLELGVWKGASLLMWAQNFPQATIIGLDVKLPQRESWPENVHVYQGDQTDTSSLRLVAHEHAPLGFDVIIDDASHVGHLSCASLNYLFRNHLANPGLYFIEDWGTGYWSHWPDGSAPETPLSLCGGQPVSQSPNRLQRVVRRSGLTRRNRKVVSPANSAGHGDGMVGLVKRLVDHVAQGDVPANYRGDALEIDFMGVHPGLAVLRKK